MQPLLSHLDRNKGYRQAFITQIGDEIYQSNESGEKRFYDGRTICNCESNFLKEKLEIYHLVALSLTKKYINVLGPTGVGKTTTIAKIAARALLEKKKKSWFYYNRYIPNCSN